MGQICIVVNRIIVVESVHNAFIEALAEQTRKMKLGHGVENGVAYGPALNEMCAPELDAISRTLSLMAER
jgi:succinate-semialdehyde dehydrogenase / glutarate-semialdehyde dehydrogenase